MLSCITWSCIKFMSRSVTASESSAKAGSKVSRGKDSSKFLPDSEPREERLSGVVGREFRPGRGFCDDEPA